MFLVKCKYGCVFTLKETRVNDENRIKCPNCNKHFDLNNHRSTNGILSLRDIGITVDRIPDSSKVNVTFDISVD